MLVKIYLYVIINAREIKEEFDMIMMFILAIVAVILVVVGITVLVIGGTTFFVIFGDLIVCAWILFCIIRFIRRIRKRR